VEENEQPYHRSSHNPISWVRPATAYRQHFHSVSNKEILMDRQGMSRRTLLKGSGMAITGLALLNAGRFAQAAPNQLALAQAGDQVIPWLDQPAENPVPERVTNLLEWEKLDSWITPQDQFFSVSHYGRPEIDVDDWQLQITGRVEHPMTLTMADLQSWPRQELNFTIECAGNHGFGWNFGLVGNARWAGVALAPLLKEAGIMHDAVEVAFYGADVGEETVREQTIAQHFARSMSIEDATSSYNLLCYEMNGEPLPTRHGYPLRLIAPGWYGIANIKWLQRIEVRSRRLMNRWMARDYVTLRREEIDGETVWSESSVGRSLLKSAPARVVRNGDAFRIEGAAWGQPIAKVEVRIDDGSWQEAQLDSEQVRRFSWRFWSLAWDDITPGLHTVTARASDTRGNVQPAKDDPWIAGKVTYWESNGQITRQVNIPES
jgi:DMSO/TMAO reductase YedYZ molybdopterin-dependent catalytic subunit